MLVKINIAEITAKCDSKDLIFAAFRYLFTSYVLLFFFLLDPSPLAVSPLPFQVFLILGSLQENNRRPSSTDRIRISGAGGPEICISSHAEQMTLVHSEEVKSH